MSEGEPVYAFIDWLTSRGFSNSTF